MVPVDKPGVQGLIPSRRFLQVPMPRRKKKLVDRVLLAYVKFAIPEPCYNGRKMARFWSSVIARSDCKREAERDSQRDESMQNLVRMLLEAKGKR